MFNCIYFMNAQWIQQAFCKRIRNFQKRSHINNVTFITYLKYYRLLHLYTEKIYQQNVNRTSRDNLACSCVPFKIRLDPTIDRYPPTLPTRTTQLCKNADAYMCQTPLSLYPQSVCVCSLIYETIRLCDRSNRLLTAVSELLISWNKPQFHSFKFC